MEVVGGGGDEMRVSSDGGKRGGDWKIRAIDGRKESLNK